ncbi:MAG: protein translocase subunit SecF [Proteobacteria bacterium]|nr:protein translocase subunit SecF [Pseudomonadota bacterium]
MRWKPIRFIPDGTKLPFMRWSRFGFFFSGILCLSSVLLFIVMGLNYGVDFKGGTVMTIRTPVAAEINQLRETLSALNIGDVEVQEYGSPNDVLIRVEAQEGGEAAEREAQEKVRGALDPKIEYLSIESVGPKVSGELTQQAILAVTVALLGVLIYLTARFEWQFAVGAIISLLHDTLLTIGLFSLFKLEFNLSIIAAILTIIGYSLNDTVVIYDRIREYLRKFKSMGLVDLIDLSMNSVLPRTLLTSVCTLIALTALYIFGGEVIRGFTFAMIWGVFVGTYSSIFVAAPVLILLGTKRDWTAEARKAAAARP